ncbi:MAG: hypothetical protein PHD48_07485 [Alphaproteobacteria bacterium]|nr:hypothetical protein [Alphaproteobacteria bacterium]
MKRSTQQILTVFFRLTSLATKLLLTLYMGRYLSLEEMGTYGLVFSATSIITCMLGMRTDYAISREIIAAPETDVAVKMRDQAAFLLLNWGGLAFAMIALFFVDDLGLAPTTFLFIFFLSTIESAADIIHINITSLGNPFWANVVFFVRAASWVFPVVLFGILFPFLRNAHFIFTLWCLGATAGVAMGIVSWRTLPWHKTFNTEINWSWLGQVVRQSAGIWLGTIGLTSGVFLDRFVVMKYLGIDSVGIITFYASFAIALLTLVHSGILSFSYPQMVKLHAESNPTGFWHEVHRTYGQVLFFGTVLTIGLGVCVPILGSLLGKEAFVQESFTFWLMLAAFWVRCCAEPLYYILFARHQDRAIWVGDILFLIPSLGLNILLTPIFGLQGIGYGALISSLLLLMWRGWFVWKKESGKGHHAMTLPLSS